MISIRTSYQALEDPKYFLKKFLKHNLTYQSLTKNVLSDLENTNDLAN
ncbi:MAG: hypothetical protein KME49_22830 [Brasilonema octagenarum HA4186-MV1]|nr:hypothetical protein [Brasilonema octagenarum HA4186-MV1]